MEIIKKAAFILVLAVLVFPRFQEAFSPITSDGLNGAFIPAPQPVFGWKSWFAAEYQDSLSRNLNDSLPFRADLVRLNNQLDYSIFRIPHGKNVIIGKNRELFLHENIDGYLSKGYQNRRFMADKARLLGRIQKILWEEKKIFMLLVIPPDKGTFAGENIPDHYLRDGRKNSDREFFMEQLHSQGVNMIDFMPVFMQMKDTSRYPLFPRSGVHWSDYGSFLAADSMFRYITAGSGYRFPRMHADALKITRKPRHDDNDIDRTMNLIWPTDHSLYAYPVISYDRDTTVKKPAALFIGDSFYWGFYNQGIIENMFSNMEYWFYDRLVFPEAFSRQALTSELDLAEVIERQNIIVIIHIGAGWGNPGSGIIDRLYATFDTTPANPIRKIEKDIRQNSQWYEWVRTKAEKEHVPVNNKIRSEAIHVYNSELLKSK